MKITAVILSIIVLFLALEPGVDFLYGETEAQHGCCGGVKDTHHQEEQDSPCSQKMCNPFQKCSSCTIAFYNTTYQFSQEYSAAQLIIFPVKQVFISRFESDFWQPPKQA